MPFDNMPVRGKTTPTLDGLIAFCDSRPPKERYCWNFASVCLLGQYGKSIGGSYDTVESLDWRLERWVALPLPHTFGAAAKRARYYRAVRGWPGLFREIAYFGVLPGLVYALTRNRDCHTVQVYHD